MIRRFLTHIIVGLRPLLGPSACLYPIGCTQYAALELEHKPLIPALASIVRRVLSCNPVTPAFVQLGHAVVRRMLYAIAFATTFFTLSHTADINPYRSTLTFYQCNPEIIRSEEKLLALIIDICIALKVNPDGATLVRCPESGYVMVQFLEEKSHITVSVLNGTNSTYIDILALTAVSYKKSLAILIKEQLEAKSFQSK